MDYQDFEIDIRPGKGREYPVAVVRFSADVAWETMRFPFDELALENQLLVLQNALLRSGGDRRRIHSVEEEAVENFGRELFNALFTGGIRKWYLLSKHEAYQQDKGLRLKLHIQSPELAALPWEFMYDPDQSEFVCLSSQTPLVRYIEISRPSEPLNVVPPLRILGMVASPQELSPLEINTEKQRIEIAIEALRTKGLVELNWLEGQTWRDLQREMRGGPWHIFHFIGHGAFDPHTDEGLIAFSDTTQKADYLSATSLGRLLADHRSLRLVVLNACEGARGGNRDVFTSTAAILMRRGIPAVLAMQYEISDRAAIELARAFYEALVDRMPVDMAVGEARKAMSLGVANSVEWGTPVLYMSSSNGVLFDVAQNPVIPDSALTKQIKLTGEHEFRTPQDGEQHHTSSEKIEQYDQEAFLSKSESMPGYQYVPASPASSNVPTPTKSVEIFYSYSHKDLRLREKLEVHLSLLKQEGLITGWYDRDILAGAEWADEIEDHLNAAHIILLLVSPDFMASDYCYSIEMKRALERHDSKEARVIPIILRPTDWERAPFSKLQVLPTDRRPISRWPDRDEAFLNVVRDIRRAVEELNAKLAASTSSQRKVSLLTDPESADKGMQAGRSDDGQRIPQSVFLFNQPLSDYKEFFGRIRERETLINRTRNAASTSIVGQRRIGKTWLITYLKLIARQELGSRFLIGYLDATAARCSTLAGFVTSAIESLTLQKRQVDTTDKALELMENVVEELTTKNQIPVLCIDEFEGFGDRPEFDLHFFTALRAMTQNGLSLIVASKTPLIDFVGDYGKTSGFFNVFEQLTLRPFNTKEAEQFVRAKAEKIGLTEEERKQILHYGQQDGVFWPARLQLVGKILLEDKTLAIREQDRDYYVPDDQNYWLEFEQHVDEIFRRMVR